MATEAEHEELYRHFVEEAWNKRPPNLEICFEFFAPTHIAHSWDGDPEHDVHGPQGHFDFVTNYHKAFPDVHIDFILLVAKNDLVWAVMTASGTFEGPYMGIPPTGKRFSIQAFGVNRIVNGQSVEAWGMVDRLGMLTQLGIIPALEPAS